MQRVMNLVLKIAGKDSHLDEVSEAVATASKHLFSASGASREKVLAIVETSSQGLTDEEASRRLDKYGKNEVVHEKAPTWYNHLLQAFINPFVGILVILAIASFITEYIFAPPGEQDLTAVVIISILVLLSVALTFFQEYQANQAADKLLSLIQNTTTVERQIRVELLYQLSILYPET